MRIKEPISYLYNLSNFDFNNIIENSKESYLKYNDIVALLLSNYKDIKIFIIKKLQDFLSLNFENKLNYIDIFFSTYSLLIDLEKENQIIKILILENIETFLDNYIKIKNKININQIDMINQIYYKSLIILLKGIKNKNKDVSLKSFLIINKFINLLDYKDKEILFRFLDLKDKIRLIRNNKLPLSFFMNLNQYILTKKEQKLIILNIIDNIDLNKTDFSEIISFYLKYNDKFRNELNTLLEKYINHIKIDMLINIINTLNKEIKQTIWVIKYLILKRLINEIEKDSELLKDSKIISFLKELSLDENSIIRKLIINTPILPYYLRINAYKKRQIKLKLSESLSINYISQNKQNK
ncbi:MAG: hypothetical protein N2485_03695 [bacterium]|nr:hypothetical protein [bacterium]